MVLTALNDQKPDEDQAGPQKRHPKAEHEAKKGHAQPGEHQDTPYAANGEKTLPRFRLTDFVRMPPIGHSNHLMARVCSPAGKIACFLPERKRR